MPAADFGTHLIESLRNDGTLAKEYLRSAAADKDPAVFDLAFEDVLRALRDSEEEDRLSESLMYALMRKNPERARFIFGKISRKK